MIYPPSQNSKYLKNIAQSSQSQEELSCSQCKRDTYDIREEQQEDESSLQVPKRKNYNLASSEEDTSIPYRKHITEQNYRFEEMLKLLQYEVDSLKKQNQAKDLLINQLKFQVHKSAVEKELKLSNNKQAYQINRLRQELGCSPRNIFPSPNNGFKSASFQYTPLSQGDAQSLAFQGEIYNPSVSLNMKQNLNSRPFYTDSIKPSTNNSADYQLRITILEKQIRQYQLQFLQQKQRLTYLEEENKWQQKFINSFVKMCDQLSFNYGQKLKLQKMGDDLKKKTKICWNYMKNLIGYFIENNSRADEIIQNT